MNVLGNSATELVSGRLFTWSEVEPILNAGERSYRERLTYLHKSATKIYIFSSRSTNG